MTDIDILFSEQDLFNRHPYADPAIIGCLRGVVPNELTFDNLSTPFQITSDFTYTPWTPQGNPPGLFGMNGPEPVLHTDLFACPSVTSTSNLLLHTSLSHQLCPPDSMLRLWQTPTNQFPSVCEEAMFFGVGENLNVQPFHRMTPPECIPVQRPITHSLGKRVLASRSPSKPTLSRPLRHTPYQIVPGSTRRNALSTPVYQCQWLDGARSCGAIVTGTKNAIGKHLQDAHAIHTRADKTDEVCQWDKCRKPMRRESIARHILAVHVGDKVPCKCCGSRFARADSLQRHQRTQCLVKGGAPGASEAAV